MEILRIDTYADKRFSQKVLYQHGCFLVGGMPYELLAQKAQALVGN